MNKIYFSHTGGFPLDEDALDFMQLAYKMGFQAIFADAGATPVIIAGMAIDPSCYTIDPGYFCYNGEIYFFPGGTIASLWTPPNVAVITLTEVGVAGVFEDTTSHDIYFTRGSALNLRSPDASNLSVSTFKRWQQIFGDVARVTPFTSDVQSAISSAGLGCAISYKKNILTNTLHILGTVTSTAAQNITNPFAYTVLTTLNYSPASADVPFRAAFEYAGTASFKNSTSTDVMQGLDMILKTNGDFSVAFIRPESSVGAYTAHFNTILPLD